MKKTIISVLIALLPCVMFAQSPQFFTYQCVVRDAGGSPVINQPVGFQLSIIAGSQTGTVVYVETHLSATNDFGIVNLEIGNGTPVSGSFVSISWGNNTHFIKVEADPTGGTGYIDMGTSQLLSVPYALYSETSGNAAIGINWLGTFATEPLSPSLNDAYYNSTDGISYIYNGSTWQVLAQDGAQGSQGIQGIQGIQGEQGIPGQDGTSINWLGSFTTSPPSPSFNDAYYNSSDKKSYIWNGAAWQMIAQDGANGADGIDGNDGINGADGKTVLNGTVDPTTQGVNGDFYINTATNTIFGPKTGGVWGAGTSLTGPQGIAGTNGTNGVDGRTVLSGTTNPTTQGSDGDYYINTSTNYLFGPKTAGAWGSGVSLVGPQGPQGTQGPAGTGLTNRGNWLSGSTYSNGDYVFDRSTDDPLVNSMWICQVPSFVSTIQPYADAGNWVEFQAPAGPQGDAGTNGTDGKTVLNGTVNPTTEGVNGDFYINTSTNTIFGPKTAGVWSAGTALVGPQGAAGTNGTNGYSVLSGSSDPTTQGVNGDFYINTTTNTIFGPKTGGVWGSGTSLVGPPGTYTAGSGIQISAGQISNTAPDQTVTISNGSGISVTGGYPAFTVTNASPNATHTGDVTGSGALTIANNAVTTLKISDGNVTAAKLNNMGAAGGQVLKYNGANWAPANEVSYSAGTGLSLAGTTFSAQTTTALWNANQIQGRSISSSAPSNGQVLGWNGTNWAPTTDLNSGTPGGVNKSVQFNNSGVFGGNNNFIWDNTNERLGIGIANPAGRVVIQGSSAAAPTEPLFEIKNRSGQQVMVVYEDSVHFYISDDILMSNKGGFAVSGRNNSKSITNDFLRVSPDSTRIWTGDTVKGFGVRNIGAVSKTSYMHLTPSNYFIGHEAGKSITTGLHNSVIGYRSGKNMTTGYSNVFLGYHSGLNAIYCYKNVLIGFEAGLSLVGNGFSDMGSQNVFIGSGAAKMATGSVAVVSIGTESGNEGGYLNTFVGQRAGYSQTGGAWRNVFLGYFAGKGSTDGDGNVCVGSEAGENLSTGIRNIFIGEKAGRNTYYANNNIAIGYYAGRNIREINNVIIGDMAGYSLQNSTGNIMIGYQAGYSETGSNELYIENSNNVTNPLVHGDFANDRIAFHRTAATYPLRVGTTTTNGNGAYLTTGGVWTNGSSRNFKDRFTDIDAKNLLSKIENMEIKGWFYKETQEYHIGPFAEDFYNAFGTGVLNSEEDLGKYLSASDVAGVSMIAVKELIKENKEQKALIGQLMQRIEALEKRDK